jgi:hypothetical protein
MLADLDLLLIAVFCIADDLLPRRAESARRMVTDAELVTLAVARAIMGIPSDERCLAVVATRVGHLFPRRPKRPGYWKRRDRLADVIEALIAQFRAAQPGLARQPAGRRFHARRVRPLGRDRSSQPAG